MTRAEFETFLREELDVCLPDERALFERTRIAVELRLFARPSYLESAWVVAWHRGEILYFNDIEGGFNTSPVDAAGAILEYWCSQDGLQGALHQWLDGK